MIIKFQGLKAAAYDGEGKQKKKDASGKDLDISKINCAMILLGQEAPEMDDWSLANRTILLHVPKKDNWTEHERNLFDDLKRCGKTGLSGILIDVLRQRDIVDAHYQNIRREVYRELKRDLIEKEDAHQSRMLNTVSLFPSMAKLLGKHVPTFKLPFTYAEFYDIARGKVVSQSESISSTNKPAVFFETVDLLLNDSSNNGIIIGRDFKIAEKRYVNVQYSLREYRQINLGVYTGVVYLCTGNIHQKYQCVRGSESLRMYNLNMNLKDHPVYIGNNYSIWFNWLEYKDEFDQIDKRVMKKELRRNEILSLHLSSMRHHRYRRFSKSQVLEIFWMLGFPHGYEHYE